jgi:sedoheptulokinase
LFDLAALAWDRKAVDKAGIRPGLLPEVLPCSSMAGRVCEPMGRLLGIPAGIPVAVALGDNQASLLATLEEPDTELGLTLGTGGQISAVMRAGWNVVPPGPEAAFEYRPYVGGRYVAVASALCGGSAWQWLAASVEGWLKDLGVKAPARDELYARLDQLGLAAPKALEVHPHFIGERYDPSLRGSISGIGVDDLTLGNLALGLAHGIVRNLATMLPEEIRHGRSRVVGSGNALRKSPLLRKAAAEELKAELIMANQREEAACGAAKNALIMLQSAP